MPSRQREGPSIASFIRKNILLRASFIAHAVRSAFPNDFLSPRDVSDWSTTSIGAADTVHLIPSRKVPQCLQPRPKVT